MASPFQLLAFLKAKKKESPRKYRPDQQSSNNAYRMWLRHYYRNEKQKKS